MPDLSTVTTFQKNVYELLLQVPKGKVTTYKDIAHTLGTRAYRGVGRALQCNPYAPTVPCHRVVASDGSIGGFQGKRDGSPIVKKIELLKKEGVSVENGRIIGFGEKRHQF